MMSQNFTCVSKEYAQLLEIAERGGLLAPTQLCFAIAVQLYTLDLNRTSMLKKFF